MPDVKITSLTSSARAGIDDRLDLLERHRVTAGQELFPRRPGELAGSGSSTVCSSARSRRRGGPERTDEVGAEELPRREEEAGVGFSRMNAASGPFRRVLSGTSHAPAASAPRAAAIQLAEFGAHTATRSPGSTPVATSPRATAVIERSTSTNESRVSPSTTASRVPKRAALRCTICGIVPARSSMLPSRAMRQCVAWPSFGRKDLPASPPTAPHDEGARMTYETIVVDIADGVATVTLNRPDVLNAFNEAMQDEFALLWREVKANDDIRAVVLTGVGDRAFSTGVDVTERLDSESPFLDREHPWAENEDPGRKLSPRRNEVWKPVIAAVHGMCAGGAFYWVADCDIVLCSPDATFFDPHVTYGFIAALEPIALTYRMPFAEVMRMALLGLHERVTAETARSIGLVTEVVERDVAAPTRPGAGPRHRRATAGGRAGNGQGALAVVEPHPRPGARHRAALHPGREPDRHPRGRP